MKTSYLVLIMSALLLASCAGNDGYRIDGTVEGMNLDGETVYLYHYGVDGRQDSAVVTNGRFTLTGVQAEPVVAKLKFNASVVEEEGIPYEGFDLYSAWFELDNSKISVTLKEVSTVKGSPVNNDLTAYIQQLDRTYASAEDLMVLMDSEDKNVAAEAEAAYEEMESIAAAIHKKFILSHINSPVSAYILYVNRYAIAENDKREIIKAAGDVIKTFPKMDRVIDNLQALEKVAVGVQFTDFEMPAPDGKNVKLSDYAGNGKVTLVDFWASWCGPCRKSMPELIEIYNTYNARGFEVVGVSFDRTHDDWVKGIAELGIKWPQMSDIKYWQCAAAAIYGVNSIPHTVLIGKDGIIAAKNLHGDALAKKIEELL